MECCCIEYLFLFVMQLIFICYLLRRKRKRNRFLCENEKMKRIFIKLYLPNYKTHTKRITNESMEYGWLRKPAAKTKHYSVHHASMSKVKEFRCENEMEMVNLVMLTMKLQRERETLNER